VELEAPVRKVAAGRERELIRRLRDRGYNVVNKVAGGGLGGGVRWTEERLTDVAAPYKSRMEFRWANQGAYATVVRLGLLDKICAHMTRPPSEKLIWTPESISEVAKKYSTRMEFRNAHLGAYTAASQLGIIDQIFNHAPNPNAPLTIEEMRDIAKSHGGECLSPKYTGLSGHLLWRCAEGHEWSASARNVRHARSWCPICAERRRNTKPRT
jgi:hypothetical protein